MPRVNSFVYRPNFQQRFCRQVQYLQGPGASQQLLRNNCSTVGLCTVGAQNGYITDATDSILISCLHTHKEACANMPQVVFHFLQHTTFVPICGVHSEQKIKPRSCPCQMLDATLVPRRHCQSKYFFLSSFLLFLSVFFL